MSANVAKCCLFCRGLHVYMSTCVFERWLFRRGLDVCLSTDGFECGLFSRGLHVYLSVCVFECWLFSRGLHVFLPTDVALRAPDCDDERPLSGQAGQADAASGAPGAARPTSAVSVPVHGGVCLQVRPYRVRSDPHLLSDQNFISCPSGRRENIASVGWLDFLQLFLLDFNIFVSCLWRQCLWCHAGIRVSGVTPGSASLASRLWRHARSRWYLVCD